MFPGLASETPSGYFLCRLWHFHHFFNAFLFSSTTWCSRFILYCPCRSRSRPLVGNGLEKSRAGGTTPCRVNTVISLLPPVLSQHQRFLSFIFLPFYACIFSNSQRCSNIDTFAHFFQSYNSLEWKVFAFGWILAFWIGKYFTSEICKHRTFFFFFASSPCVLKFHNYVPWWKLFFLCTASQWALSTWQPVSSCSVIIFLLCFSFLEPLFFSFWTFWTGPVCFIHSFVYWFSSLSVLSRGISKLYLPIFLLKNLF